jgi:hypothetical protein
MHSLYHGKGYQKIWVTSVIFIKLPNVNIHPTGKNSPNLVTLPVTNIKTFKIFSPKMWHFFLQNTAFCKIWITTFILGEKR